MRNLHATAGILALTLVALFWTASLTAEIAGDREAMAAVKTAIAWGLLALVPAVVAANGSGFGLARPRPRDGHGLPPLLARKRRRGIAVAAIGLTVLMPCALWLASAANAPGPLPATFHAVQALELAGGALNATLLAMNARDGRRLRAPRRRVTHLAPAAPENRAA
jgi:hypothetical protein